MLRSLFLSTAAQTIFVTIFLTIFSAPMTPAQSAQDAQSPRDTEGAAINDGTSSYPRSYFDKYNPQTAGDMVARLPGFTLDEGSTLRGFGANAGNVLIDGARPSSKTGGVEDLLKRIPANSIARIEVLRGASGASEAAGQAMVANIIRTKGIRSGSWEAQIARAADGRMNFNGQMTYAQNIGAWEASAKLSGARRRSPLAGTRISRDAADALTFFELEESPFQSSQTAFSTEWKRPLAGGVMTLNGRVSWSPFGSATERLGFVAQLPNLSLDAFSGASPDERLTIDFDRETIDGELGADWARPLGDDWSLKVLSLASFRDRDQVQIVNSEAPFGMPVSNSNFARQQETIETILRATAGRGGKRKFRPEFGGEIAYNSLDSNLSLRFEDATGVTNIDLPAANVLVEELRGEAFANLIWDAAPKLTVEMGIAAELSEITVSGDASSTQSFFFAKPFTTLIYKPAKGVQFHLAARRTVGQLNFSDFAATASASDDRLTAGNPELGPDQTTSLSFTVDLQSETRGAVNIEAFHEWRDDILEQIVLPSGDQGTGNAGSARVWGLRANASLPLSAIIPGGLIELETEFLDSTFLDPIIGAHRVVSFTDSPTIDVSFRQDLTDLKVAWGVTYRAEFDGIFFFADEESLNRDGRNWSVFAETARFFGFKTKLEFSNIGKQNFFRERRFFSPDRSGAFTGSQVISRDTGMLIALTASGQF